MTIHKGGTDSERFHTLLIREVERILVRVPHNTVDAGDSDLLLLRAEIIHRFAGQFIASTVDGGQGRTFYGLVNFGDDVAQDWYLSMGSSNGDVEAEAGRVVLYKCKLLCARQRNESTTSPQKHWLCLGDVEHPHQDPAKQPRWQEAEYVASAIL